MLILCTSHANSMPRFPVQNLDLTLQWELDKYVVYDILKGDKTLSEKDPSTWVEYRNRLFRPPVIATSLDAPPNKPIDWQWMEAAIHRIWKRTNIKVRPKEEYKRRILVPSGSGGRYTSDHPRTLYLKEVTGQYHAPTLASLIASEHVSMLIPCLFAQTTAHISPPCV
jgi:hypothetical protein